MVRAFQAISIVDDVAKSVFSGQDKKRKRLLGPFHVRKAMNRIATARLTGQQWRRWSDDGLANSSTGAV